MACLISFGAMSLEWCLLQRTLGRSCPGMCVRKGCARCAEEVALEEETFKTLMENYDKRGLVSQLVKQQREGLIRPRLPYNT